MSININQELGRFSFLLLFSGVEVYKYLFITNMNSMILTLMIVWGAMSKLYTNEFSTPTIRRNKGWIFLDRLSVGSGKVDINFEASFISAKIPEG